MTRPRKVKARLVHGHGLYADYWKIHADRYDAMVEQFWNRCLREYDAGCSMSQAVQSAFKEIGIERPAP